MEADRVGLRLQVSGHTLVNLCIHVCF